MKIVRRLVRAALVFVGASIALLVTTAQCAPGWQAAPTEPPLDPEQEIASGTLPSFAVEQVAAAIPSDAGHAVRAWIVKPASGSTNAPVPGVVLVHGAGPGDRDSLLSEARALASAGVAAIVYDKRVDGYSIFSRDYTRLADDAIRAAEVLAHRSDVDPQHIGIMGWSEGGWVAPTAVQRAPNRFAFLGLVSAPIVSPLAQAVWTADQPLVDASHWVRRMPATALSSGRQFIDYLDFDIQPALESVRIPVHAVWGAEDMTVPVNVAVRTLMRLVDAPATVRILPDSGHSVGSGQWLAEAAVWMSLPPGSAGDEIRGTEPPSRAGLATLPRDAWFTNPLGHAALAIALAVTSFLVRPRPHSASNGEK